MELISGREAAVATRKPIGERDISRLLPAGCLVAKLPRDAVVDAADDWPATKQALAGPLPLDYRPAVGIVIDAYLGRPAPLLLSVAGFVLAGAHVLGAADIDASGRNTLALSAPGGWLRELQGRPIALGRGRALQWVGGPGRLPERPTRRDR